jgi:hypothetical protein
MAVAARLNTTYWGLLKQPDNQKAASAIVEFLAAFYPFLPIGAEATKVGVPPLD